ncbi:hypothetical protein FSARC_12312, partial [Fusarium sarcochroum]
MATTAAFQDFIQRYSTVQAYESSREKLLQDLLLYCQAIEENLGKENLKLKQQLHEAELDLNAATQTRRELQTKLQDAESHIKWVVTENDELKFQDKFISQGLEGGKRAANALRAAVADLCNHERTGSLEIVCRVVANVAGLGKAMCRDGSIEDPSVAREFALGFTRAKASFDFIDVGYGKERADSKIRETTRWHLGNQNCKHVLLGIGHDSGYAPFLDEVLQDEVSKKCVSLIKGVPMTRELDSLDMNVIEFNDLFRTTKLVDKSPVEKLSANRTEPIRTQASPTVSLPTQAVLTPATSNASLSPPASSWAKVTKSASPPPQLT